MPKTIRVGRGRYKTFSDLPAQIDEGTTVIVLPGSYADCIRCLPGVSYVFQDATIEWDGNGAAIMQEGGSVSFTGKIVTTRGMCIHSNGGILRASGTFIARDDYAILTGSDAIVTGYVESTYNSAIHCSWGTLELRATVLSHGWLGLEYSGGFGLSVNDSIIESRGFNHPEEGSACSLYGGENAKFSNCQFICEGADVFSIGTQRSSYPVTLLSDCIANRPADPRVVLSGPGGLKVA